VLEDHEAAVVLQVFVQAHAVSRFPEDARQRRLAHLDRLSAKVITVQARETFCTVIGDTPNCLITRMPGRPGTANASRMRSAKLRRQRQTTAVRVPEPLPAQNTFARIREVLHTGAAQSGVMCQEARGCVYRDIPILV